MANEFKTILTPLGRAKIAAAIESATKLNLTSVAVGDGAGKDIDPETLDGSLVREVWRGDILDIATDPDNPARIVIEVTIPPDVGGWVLREFGVFDENGAMIAAGNLANTYKPVAVEGSTREMLIRVIIEVGTPECIELKIDGTIILATKKYVDDKVLLKNTLPGGIAGQVLAKKTNEDGSFEWINIQDAGEVTVDIIEERQSLVAGQLVVELAKCSTNGVAVYIDGFRKITGVDFEITGETQITLKTAATAGQVFLAVQNNPEGVLSLLRREQNLADLADAAEARENLGVMSKQQAAQEISKAQNSLLNFDRNKKYTITNIRSKVGVSWYGFNGADTGVGHRTKAKIPANADYFILALQAGDQIAMDGAGLAAFELDMNMVRAILSFAKYYFFSPQFFKDTSDSSNKHYYDRGMTMTIYKDLKGGDDDYIVSAIGIGPVPTEFYTLTKNI